MPKIDPEVKREYNRKHREKKKMEEKPITKENNNDDKPKQEDEIFDEKEDIEIFDEEKLQKMVDDRIIFFSKQSKNEEHKELKKEEPKKEEPKKEIKKEKSLTRQVMETTLLSGIPLLWTVALKRLQTLGQKPPVPSNGQNQFMDNMKDFSYDMLKMPMVASKQDRFKERLKNDKIISRAMNNRLFETLNGLEFRLKWVVSYCFHYTKTFVEKE